MTLRPVTLRPVTFDPRLGRFTSADPTIQYPGDLQSYNRYSYVLNNPFFATDPSGFVSDSGWSWSGFFSGIKKDILPHPCTHEKRGHFNRTLNRTLGSGLTFSFISCNPTT